MADYRVVDHIIEVVEVNEVAGQGTQVDQQRDQSDNGRSRDNLFTLCRGQGNRSGKNSTTRLTRSCS